MNSLSGTKLTIGVIFLEIAFCLSAGMAEPSASITSSGLNTQISHSAVPPAGTVQYDITGGTRSGTNLFHSFGEFNLPHNNIANFLNDTGSVTSNILGRVTGGHASNILGTIQTTGFGNANLFLMNPSGIVFGPSASLNVGGSVTFTTADYLRLDKVGGPNAGIFHASPAQGSLLTSAPVDAFGFLGTHPVAVAVHGSQLTVPDGHSISLIGGNITIQNGELESGTIQPVHLAAPNGQINLATAKSPGEFLQDLTATPNINGVSFKSLGSVHIASDSIVDVSQTGNGKISIRGGQLVLEIQSAILDTSDNAVPGAVSPGHDTISLAPGSSIISQTTSSDRGPDIQIVADRVRFEGSPPPYISEETLGPRVKIWARTDGSGNSGNISLRTTGDIEIINLVRLESFSGFSPDGRGPSPVLVSGNAGNIELTSAHGNIRMTGMVTWATSQTDNSSGKTGTVNASALEGDIILDRASLFTHASSLSSSGGQVQVTARNLRVNGGILATDNLSQYKPDGITVMVSSELAMSGNSFIVTTAFNPAIKAPAGDITLTAKDIVATQGSLISSETFSTGAGGQLKIFADTLQLKDGSQIKSGSTFNPNIGQLVNFPRITPTGPGGDITIQTRDAIGSVLIDGPKSGIFADTEGTGTGGSINLSAKTLTMHNGATISASTIGTDARAVGGSIDVRATDQVMLTNGASITASSKGPANAGNIKIDAGRQLNLQNSGITTEAKTAGGGNIEVIAIDRMQLANSQISTSVREGAGDSGQIFIDPREVIIQNNSKIFAQAVRGSGGDITILTPRFLQDQTSLVDASSQFGQSGKVTIQSSTSNLSGTVAQLTSKTDQTQPLLQNRCVALAGGEQSTFILAGRDAFPAEPGGWLSSPVAMEHWTGGDTEEHASGLMVRRKGPNGLPAMAADKTNVLSLRRLTPPGFLVRTFATGATGCPS